MSSIAMAAAVSGLSNFQKMLDVVANNISNVNTAGYKSNMVNFQAMMSQTLHPATAPNPATGGSNALQIGLGSTLASVDAVLTQGVIEVTGNPTDLALSGDGYFVVGNGIEDAYTRNGHFQVDSAGNIVDTAGRAVKGWQAANGVINTTAAITGLKIPLGDAMTAQATSKTLFLGNLDGGQALYAAGPPPTGGRYSTETTLFDSLGQDYRVTVDFQKVAAPAGAAAAWSWTATQGATSLGTGTVAFDSSGNYSQAFSTPVPNMTLTPVNGAAPVSVTPDFTAMTQLVTPNQYTVHPGNQDGYAAGVLTNFTIDRSGAIIGQYFNSMIRPLGQIAIASFPNPQGLEKVQAGLLRRSVNSGNPNLGSAGSGSRGELTSGALEASNVDLATEFTRMIQAQRAFQANSKVITTMDDVLQEVTNLKR